MKRHSTLFLKSAIILFGLVVLAVLVFGIPRAIGDISVGGYDPILFGVYVAAVPFFIALAYAMKLLGYIDLDQAFSSASTKAFKGIKYCAATIAGLFTAGLPYIYYVAEIDDAPGVIVLGMAIVFASFVVATFAAVLQKLVDSAVAIKSENDLTV